MPSPAWRGPWRVAVDETSMAPALRPGDWLLVDPTVRRWPRRGSIVVVREPESEVLVIKRVAARLGDLVDAGIEAPGVARAGAIRLEPDEAWLVGDAPGSHDSRHYGPVTLDRLVARAWFRYGPLSRIGLLRWSGRLRPSGSSGSAGPNLDRSA
jgi:signal peptidase I